MQREESAAGRPPLWALPWEEAPTSKHSLRAPPAQWGLSHSLPPGASWLWSGCTSLTPGGPVLGQFSPLRSSWAAGDSLMSRRWVNVRALGTGLSGC